LDKNLQDWILAKVRKRLSRQIYGKMSNTEFL